MLLPPGGETLLVERILQVGAIGREYADIPGTSERKTIEAWRGSSRRRASPGEISASSATGDRRAPGAPDGGPREIPPQYVSDPDWEAKGRRLMHVYPATHGPHNPNIGHSIPDAEG